MSLPTVTARFTFWSACLGNLLEHYDTALFGFLSPFLAPLLFPTHEPIMALILTYAIIPLSMLARPIGALVFGYIGDRRGRGQALFITLGGMGVVSCCMGCIPTYAQVGILAPILIYLGRLLENFFAAGEVNGGAIFILENAPEKRHDLLSGFFSASTLAGILLASAGISWLCHYRLVETGWRWLYFFGFITALFGCLIRYRLPSTTASSPTTFSQSFLHLRNALSEEKRALFWIAIIAGFDYANYMIALVLMNGFVPLISSVTKEEMATMNISLLLLDFCTLPFFGWLASKISRERLMLSSALAIALFGIPLMMLVEGRGLGTILFVRICCVCFGVAFAAPFHSWALQLVAPKNRYTVISFGYALGSQLIGGPTAALSLWLFNTTGMVSSVAWYWVSLALGSAVTILFLMRAKVQNRQAAQPHM